jgi:hypothetical protein
MKRQWFFFAVSHALLACGSEAKESPTAEDRAAWNQWAEGFVAKVCAHDDACGVPTGAACVESGDAAAAHASCDAAVSFYLANREKLNACTNSYPTSCAITPDQACPLLTKEHSFEELCP